MVYKDKEKKKIYDLKFRQEHPDYYRNYYKKHYQENKSLYNQRSKKWYRENKKYHKELMKRWKEENIEDHKNYLKKYCLSHKEQIKKASKKCYQTHKEDYYRRWVERYRLFGFVPLNQKIPNSEAHHLDINNVIYIPTEIHKNISHKQDNEESMIITNLIAWDCLESGAL